MRRIISQLRKKPHHIRERIAIGFTFFGALVLMFFWVSIVRYEIFPEQNLAKSRSPIQTLGDIFKNTYKGAVANVGSFAGFEITEKKQGEGKLILVPQNSKSAEDINNKESDFIQQNP